MEQTETTDIVLLCVDCGASYILSPQERQWYLTKGLHLPRRCPTCRARRRQEAKRTSNPGAVQR
jgi:hypothetical protein